MYRHFLHFILFSIPLAFAACEGNAPSVPDDRQVQVTFTLAAGAPAATRADGPTWGDDYPSDSGTWRETDIAPGDLSVWLYTADGTNRPVAQVENISYFRSGGGLSYTYYGTLAADDAALTPETTYKIMVMANCGKPGFGMSPPSALTFRQTAQYIPLWGVKAVMLDLKPGVSQNIGEIELLRAMAKIEITLADNITDDYTLVSATLDRYCGEGYCLPEGWDKVEETAMLNRDDDSYAPSFRPFSGSAVTSGVEFVKTDAGDGLVCYLPEYEADPAHPATMTVNVNGRDYPLELKDYVTDEYYSLVRNHLYRFEITDVYDGELTVKVTAQEWSGPQESEIEYSNNTGWQLVPYGIDVSSNQLNDLSLGDQSARFGVLTYPRYDDGNAGALVDESSIALFTFHYPKPMGTVWTAHLSNNEDFELVEDNGFAVTGIDRMEDYKIGVRAKKRWTEGTSFDGALTQDGQDWEDSHTMPSTYLYITITYDGRNEEELVINGIHTDTGTTTGHFFNAIYKDKRRFPGTDTRIWIRQLRARQGMTLWNLAEDIAPGDPGYEWWRVNPYWDHEAAAQTQH